MAEIQLTDLVLLRSHFEMWPRGATSLRAESEDAGEIFEYPPGDFLELFASATQEKEGEFVLYLQAKLDDDAFPFELDILLGARFKVGDSELEPDTAEKTLVWLCYPYLRELVASITGRSPLPTYYVPALVRMPHPSVLDAVIAPTEPSPAISDQLH